MNHIVLTGNLGRPRDGSHPVRLYNSGTDQERCNFQIAVNRGRGDKQTTTWMDVTLFGPQATNVAEKTVPGQQLHVQGELVSREIGKDATGQYDRGIWQIEAARFDGVTFGLKPSGNSQANGNGNGQANGQATPAAEPAAVAAASEEIPF